MNKLISACAGAGKTHRIVSEAIQAIDKGERILIITYTINNQKEKRTKQWTTTTHSN